MAGELAHDSVTGALVYSPATGQLALDCPDAEPPVILCTDEACVTDGDHQCYCVADTYSLEFEDVTACAGCFENVAGFGSAYLEVTALSFNVGATCLPYVGASGGDNWGVGANGIQATVVGTMTIKQCSNSDCSTCTTSTDVNLLAGIYNSCDGTPNTMRVRVYALGSGAGNVFILFDVTMELPDDGATATSAQPNPATVNNDYVVGDCGDAGQGGPGQSGIVVAYGGTVRIVGCCEVPI